MSSLFESYRLGDLTLQNRVVMAPMTRSRAPDAGQVTEQTAIYYAQRASAGLIISEGTSISAQSQGFIYVPGIYTDPQTRAWKKVTRAVHAAGGRIFCQLWHVGRISHPSLRADAAPPVSSVAVRAENATCFARRPDGTLGRIPPTTPHALTPDEIAQTVRDYADAAHNAIAARFDGVEIHAANGYLIEQFINAGLNTRTDAYGGGVENRARFGLEVLDAVAARIGRARTAVRLSPFGRASDMHAFAGERETWLWVARALAQRELAYIHLNNHETPDGWSIPDDFFPEFRQIYPGPLILAGGFDRARAETMIDRGLADLIAFGRPFIANPDLVARMQNHWPLAERDQATVYGGDAHGYTDYPTYSD